MMFINNRVNARASGGLPMILMATTFASLMIRSLRPLTMKFPCFIGAQGNSPCKIHRFELSKSTLALLSSSWYFTLLRLPAAAGWSMEMDSVLSLKVQSLESLIALSAPLIDTKYAKGRLQNVENQRNLKHPQQLVKVTRTPRLR